MRRSSSNKLVLSKSRRFLELPEKRDLEALPFESFFFVCGERQLAPAWREEAEAYLREIT